MRRGRIDIVGEILAVASEGVGKTALVYRTNLNFILIDRYLNLLVREGLISAAEDSPVRYRTTAKGIDFLKSYVELRKVGNF